VPEAIGNKGFQRLAMTRSEYFGKHTTITTEESMNTGKSTSNLAPAKSRERIRGISNLNFQVKLCVTIAFIALVFATVLPEDSYHFGAAAQVAGTANGFPYSTPITLNSAGTQLWVTNPDPDNNSVTVLNVATDAATVIKEIPVGKEPNSIALNADGSRAYVANTLDGTVSVINTEKFKVIATIKVGVEPRALCFTPNFSKLYVACSSSNNIQVINPTNNTLTKVIENPSFNNLFAMTITNDGDADDNDELLYVTNLFAEYVPGSAPKPADDLGKEGIVNVVSVATDVFIDRVSLGPVKTAFKSNGRGRNASGDGIAPANPAAFTVDTSAFPNQITAVAGARVGGTNRIYTFATGSSPTGPIRFNVMVQSLVSLIQGLDDAGQTANINDEIRLEPNTPFADGVPKHRFASMPWGLAFYHNSFKALGIASAADCVMVMDFDQNGKAFIDRDPTADKTNIVRILTGTKRDPNPDNSLFLDGKTPRGVVINQNDTRAYTFNYVSRDVTIIDLVNEKPVITVATTESKGDAVIQYGKELFNTGMGPLDTSNKNANGTVNPIEGRMSDAAWMGCVSCHVNGLTDGVTWHFGSGPRVSVALNTSFAPKTGQQQQRALNWSAVFDEVADFEDNTRNTAGGAGLFQLANGDQDPVLNAFNPPSAGRDGRRDAITSYVKTVRTPVAPEDDNDPQVQAGRNLFKKVGCAECHGGPLWSKSRVEFPAPPPVNEVNDQQLIKQLLNVGTFNPNSPHEVRGAAGNLNQVARGALGFNPASLLGVFQRERFLTHDGSVTSFEQLFENQAHVGTHPKLKKAASRKNIIKFLRSIDDNSVPF
jgi:YVTN family beta-propeller protein